MSTEAFSGSGHLTCRHATEWPCDFWLAQLFNGRIVVQVWNVQRIPHDLNRWLDKCEPFDLIGTLNDGRSAMTRGIHWTWSFGLTEKMIEGVVHRPGYMEISRTPRIEIPSQRVICEISNLFLGRVVGPIESNVGQACIQFNRLSCHADNRRRMEALKTAGILSSVSVEPVELISEDHLGDMVDTLCSLLTFAQRSPVSCVAQHSQDVSKTIVRSRYQEPVFYYPTMFRPLIPSENLAAFVQDTFGNYSRQWKLWDLGHAIDHYVQAIALHSAWSQAVGIFTALETLKNAYLQQPRKNNLEYFVSEGSFRKRRIASQVMELLGSNFVIFNDLPDDEKDALSGKIRGLNQRAYKLILKKMFQELRMPVDEDDLALLVRLRNQIIHGGSPDYQKGPWKNPSKASEVASRFAGLVEKTILAILDFQGDSERYDQVAVPSDK